MSCPGPCSGEVTGEPLSEAEVRRIANRSEGQSVDDLQGHLWTCGACKQQFALVKPRREDE